MKKLYKILLVLALAETSAFSVAQNVSPVDFMPLNPYQLNANPAADLPYISVMSLGIGNVNLDFQNTGLRYDNLFDFDAQGYPTMVNLRKLADGLHPRDYVGLDVSENIFFLCKRVKKGLMSYSHNVRAQVNVGFTDDLFQLLGYGNGAFVGEAHPAQVDANVNAQAFQEFALGYQYNLDESLSIGGRAKLLFGFANVKTDAVNATLTTDADTYALRLQENIAVNTSMPSLIYMEDGQLKSGVGIPISDLFRNLGFGLDFAAEYRFDDRFSAVAAVTDLGFIHWSGNNFRISSDIAEAGQFYDNGSFLFEGLDADQLQHLVTDAEYRKAFVDTLQDYLHVNYEEYGSYMTSLHTNLLLRGNYDLDANNRFAAQLQGRFTGCGFRPALTLAYCGSFLDNFSVCATYTAMPRSYANFGLGLGAMIETCHIYVATNNIIGCFKPLDNPGFNAQVGIVFNMFKPERHFIDESGRPDYLE